MIVFDLRCCAGGHVFEAWFGSSDGFTDQQARGLIRCPVCDDAHVEKAVMAPRLTAKGNQREPVVAQRPDLRAAAQGPMAEDAGASNPPTPAIIRTVLAHIAAQQAAALPASTWVGGKFAEEARAMHEGLREPAAIHGQATVAEAEALHGDGIAVMPLLVPVVPPELQN